MNLDFHYYGTYVAARLAGYDFNSAQTIAHAAQYVDDSSLEMLQDPQGQYYIKDFTPIPTVLGMGEMLDKNYNWSEEALNSLSDVWVPFHFLPGNYGDLPNMKKYTGPTSDKGTIFKWSFDEESAKQFKMLCQPNSLTVKAMVNDIIDNHSNKDYSLAFTGMRMHVLADTWAHMFYIGMPAWFINDAHEEVYTFDGDKKTAYEWKRAWPWDDSTNLIDGDTATPNMPAYNSVVYLGHGRMGHLPDYPWLKYEYTPRWSKGPITKDNTSFFLQAFKQLTKALTCIKNKTPFDLDSYADLPAETEKTIKEILSTSPQSKDQSETWKANIGKIEIDNTSMEVPAEYDKDQWLETFKTAKDQKKTDYYYFNSCTNKHLKLVQDSLSAYDIYFDSIPSKHIVKTKFKCKNGKYIGSIDSNDSTQYYPKMQTEGIELQIIKQSSKSLCSGDVVEIRTTEPLAKKYNFLGAWETKSLYYYTKDYDIEKQKWQVVKIGAPEGDKIKAGDLVQFKNRNFDKKPYMCTYDALLGGTYLTTEEDGTSDNAIWIMDGLTEINN